MATCKDCLHIDVCYMVEHYGVDIEEDRQECDCHQFQAKTNCVEVVRCKDCKYWKCWRSSGEGTGDCNLDEGYSTLATQHYDFCSYGERKDNEKCTD